MAEPKEPKTTISILEPCPLVTVGGKPYCLNETCRVRGIQGVTCPPLMPEDALPDLLIGWEPASFKKARKEGVWNHK